MACVKEILVMVIIIVFFHPLETNRQMTMTMCAKSGEILFDPLQISSDNLQHNLNKPWEMNLNAKNERLVLMKAKYVEITLQDCWSMPNLSW